MSPAASTWARSRCREPDAGSDIASIRTRAERDGDEWVINGQKMWCTFADQADCLIVVARTTPYDPPHRHAGIRSFFIPKERGNVPGRRSGAIRSARSATTGGRRGSCRSTTAACRTTAWSLARTTRRDDDEGFSELSRGADDRARPHRRPRDRSGPRRARGLDRLLPAARAVRPSDRRLPGAAVQDRRRWPRRSRPAGR